MPEDRPEQLPPHDRRDFFRSSLARLLKPAAEFIANRLPIELPLVGPELRPPGAVPESQFLEQCYRCGNCVDACPAGAIFSWSDGDDLRRGTPYLDPDRRACVLCDDLACMKSCASGALQLVDRAAIRIGLAEVDDAACLRSGGEDCTVCIDACPLGSTAIRLDGSTVEVLDPRPTGEGCTGCGVCQEQCPTRPKRAIRVVPY
ncbi:MAG: 4Fe-4S dicluster domain-containing protein [Phycisphaerae bacterium]